MTTVRDPLTAQVLTKDSATSLRDTDALRVPDYFETPILHYIVRRTTAGGFIFEMPHSVTPEPTPGGDSSRTISQATMDPESPDIPMADAPSPAEAETTKVNLEELFNDEDSDAEFGSSAPLIKSEEEPSQPEPMFGSPCHYAGRY